ncbi:MAG: XamI family restriction endonuclease [bacterium]|nr:XamI family restriction endonuclease [bacterium]MDE0419203.1 XamI family restriction endonuclease [bacterium]
MLEPPHWSAQQLREDAALAGDLLRKERLDEPRELYAQFFDAFLPVLDRLIDQIEQLAEDELDPYVLAAIMKDPETRMAFRYLTAPPISEDDLTMLANARISPAALRSDPSMARRVRDSVLHVLDSKRFPWIVQGRDPRGAERTIATVASAALAATQKVRTRRGSDAKSRQEEAVMDLLRGMQFKEVARRDIQTLRDAPEPGEFCSACTLGNRRADMVAGLHDRRVLALEYKVSNSEANSSRRVNHEAAGKARAWLAAFGGRGFVPAAVLSGVFKPDNLASAQAERLALFWFHRLDDLRTFIEASRPRMKRANPGRRTGERSAENSDLA